MSFSTSIQRLGAQRTLVRPDLPGLSALPRWVPGGHPRSIDGLRIVITGASSGIGHASARQLAAQGAEIVAVARREEQLVELCAEITAAGGVASYHVADLADKTGRLALLAELQRERVDVLVNNAGRSIRRSVTDSTQRLHDYRRTMELNYFASVQLITGLLPAMLERKQGQIVNVCTAALLSGIVPKYSAYAASKAALDAFGKSLAAEIHGQGVAVTHVYYPLVRTEMIAPTTKYDDIGALTEDEAGEWLVHAVTRQPARVTPIGMRAAPLGAVLAPQLMGHLVNRFV